MIRTISRIGNSHGIILDSEILELARLGVGDEVNLVVHEGGTITLTPICRRPSRAQVKKAIKRTMKDYADTMKKLA